MDYDPALEIFTEAHKRKYLGANKKKDICLANYINTANRILNVIETGGADGLNRHQLSVRLKLDGNTINCYCRILSNLNLISYSIDPQNGRGKIYRSIKYDFITPQ